MPLTLLKLPFTFPFSRFGPFLIYLILFFSPLIEGGTTYYPVAIIEIILLILLLTGLHSFWNGNQSLSLKAPPFRFIATFLVYLVLMILFFTPYKLSAIHEMELFVAYIILFYFSIFFNITRHTYKERVINLLLTIGLFEALFGMVQYFVFHQRAKGTFFNPDFFGEYLAIIFSVLLGRFFDSGNLYPKPYPSPSREEGIISLPRWEEVRGRVKKYHRWIVLNRLLFLGTGIFLSQSRGAALAWSTGISFVLWKRFQFRIFFAWLILLLLFLVVPNPLQYRILKDYKEDPYSFSRLEMWKEAIEIIKVHPLGIGIDMYPFISSQYAFPIPSNLQHYSKVAESPHNDYMRLFSEIGIPGGVFFIFSLFLSYFKWVGWTEKNFTYYGALGGTLVFFIHALVDSNFHEPALVITVIVLSTLLLDKRLFQFKPFNLSTLQPKVIFRLLLFTFSLLLLFFIIKPPLGWYFYSRGYHESKNHHINESARNFYIKAVFWESNNSVYHNALANSYFNTFQKSNNYHYVFKALEELHQALSLNPMDGNYFTLKGEIYQTLAAREQNPAQIQELLDDAFTNYREALKLLPYDVSLYLNLGMVEEVLGKLEDAEKHYNRAIEIEPNYLLAREKKIEFLFRRGEKETVLRNYQELNFLNEQLIKRANSDSEKGFIFFDQEKLKKTVEKLKNQLNG